jgi:hypothetical protein
MPAMKPNDPNHRHHARLIYDKAYEDPKARELKRQLVHVNVENRAVDLTDLKVAEEVLDPYLPSEIPSIAEFTHPVPKSQVTGTPDGTTLTGRLSLAAGALSFCGLGAPFSLQITEEAEARLQRMAVRTEWTVRGITSTVSIGAETHPGLPERVLSDRKLPNLYPIGGTIHLLVFHAVAREFPPEGEDFFVPKQGKDADHFPGYYKVCPPLHGKPEDHIPAPAEEMPIDVFDNGDQVENEGDQTPGMTCVQAQAVLEGDRLLRRPQGAEKEHIRSLPLDQRVM